MIKPNLLTCQFFILLNIGIAIVLKGNQITIINKPNSKLKNYASR